MSRYICTYCDCCGRELTGRIDIGEPELFVTMIVGKTGPIHYCFDCARYCLDAWAKEQQRIIKNKLVKVAEFDAHKTPIGKRIDSGLWD